MNIIDVSIIGVYVLLTLFVGIWVSKRASKGLKSYFLGGNDIKWYFLGLSNGSGMFDISGTAWMVGIFVSIRGKKFHVYVDVAYLEPDLCNDVSSSMDSEI